MKRRVLLISANMEKMPYPVAPLGLSLIASSLKGEYDVKIFDAAFEDVENLPGVLKKYKPHFIGISIRNVDNVTMKNTRYYLPVIKTLIFEKIKTLTTAPIILGGSGFNINPEHVLDYFNADYGIIGDGEKAFVKLLKDLSDNHVQVKRKTIIRGEELDPDQFSTSWSNIDYHLNIGPYVGRSSYPIQSKRGCTFQCIYCSYPKIEGKSYRLRDPSDIVDEMELTSKRLKNVSFEFVDSTFNSPRGHAESICREIIKRGLNVKIRTMGINPGGVTDELVSLMKQAGFTQIDCTPETASEKMLKSFRKNFSKRKIIESAKILKKYDMPTMWFFMLGAPGETETTIQETFEFIDKHIAPEDIAHITEGIRIIPDTELQKIAIQEGVIKEQDSLLEPVFYVSPTIGENYLSEILEREINKRKNVIHSAKSKPEAELMKRAIQYRNENQIDEPMFRTLMRLKE